ncbi:uncharacterized protein RJT20DRAFT_37905 [Scheffersomyces xylosifermentans]|uniref:uncharacterized protein n=1 Tax=Scheffersomyces xylosifermentans TaxID=1304137 RepID=UPI00315CC58E
MKISSLYLIAGSLAVSGVSAFADTGSFYSSLQLKTGKYDVIAESEKLAESVKAVTEKACSSEDNKIVIYRVKNLVASSENVPENGSFIKYVHYNSAQELEFQLGDSCDASNVKYVSGKNSDVSTEGSSVIVIDIEDNESHGIEEFVQVGDNTNVIVQGKPSFHTSGSKVDGLKNIIEDQVYENLNIEIDLDNVLSKRSKSVEEEPKDDAEYNKLLEDVAEDFKAAESFIAEEGDGIVTINDEDTPKKPGKVGEGKVPAHSSLFTHYQFFTPGIFSGLIVGFLFLSILYGAISWISAIEISYSSFEKQVDFDKKTE